MKSVISLFLCCFASGIAVTSLIGYILKDMRWASWAPDAVPMAVTTAVAIISLAVAFLLRWSGRRNGHCK